MAAIEKVPLSLLMSLLSWLLLLSEVLLLPLALGSIVSLEVWLA
jgi:hypothetical protein